MPELPEVETIRCALVKKVIGQRIHRVRVRKDSRLLRDTVSSGTIKRRLTGKGIEAIGRRGKYLVFALDSGDFLVIHLGMTGCLYIADAEIKPPLHQHLRLELDDTDLVLVDPRTFGRILFIPAGRLEFHRVISRLGPEPLDHDFSAKTLGSVLSRRGAPLKAVLLDQSAIAGLGNIYADEVCFRAKVSPLRPANSLSASEVKALHSSIQRVLRQAIAKKGTTIRDYQWEAGRSGGFLDKLKVYGREGRTCPRCQNRIKRVVVAGRSTCFCPQCQK